MTLMMVLYALGLSRIDDILLAQRNTFLAEANLRQVREMRKEIREFWLARDGK